MDFGKAVEHLMCLKLVLRTGGAPSCAKKLHYSDRPYERSGDFTILTGPHILCHLQEIFWQPLAVQMHQTISSHSSGTECDMPHGCNKSWKACYGPADSLQKGWRHVCAIKRQIWPQLCSILCQVLLGNIQPAQSSCSVVAQ